MTNYHFRAPHIIQPDLILSLILKTVFKGFCMVFKTEKTIVGVLLFFLMGSSVRAQISPPGLGEANTAFWTAFGIKRQLDSLGKKQSLSYIALGRKSSPDNDNLFSKQAIFVLNHEVYHSFTSHQQYSYAISYRRQPVYEDATPYEKEGLEQEIRLYGRYAYTFTLGKKWKLKNTIRQEFRKFFDPDFRPVEENFQLRTRLKTQLTYNLSSKNNQKLAVSAEGLFSISYLHEPEPQWTAFGYRELRLGVYYMVNIPNSPFTVDIGYVNDLIRNSHSITKGGVHYLAADLVWNLPYKKK